MIDPIDPKATAVRLETLRDFVGLDKSTFAASIGVDPSTYTRIVRGERPLRAQMAYDLARRWGVTMDYFYTGSLKGLDPEFQSAAINAETQE